MSTMQSDQSLEPTDDGLPTRDSGPWVREKLFYINRYMQMFVKAMTGKQWHGLRYIDLFAGPGKCRIEETGEILLGSPLLALTMNPPFNDYVFVELNSDTVECLKKRVSSSANKDRVSFIAGDSNREVRKIVERIIQDDKQTKQNDPDAWSSLNLALLDPTGLQVEWETIVELARLRTDLIIHYSQFGLNRNLDLCAKEPGDTVIDRFFGNREWRKIQATHQKAPGEIHSKLVQLYHDQLADLGYVNIRELGGSQVDPLMKTTQTNAPLYRLIFASKSKLAHQFWKEVTKRDVHGQRRLF